MPHQIGLWASLCGNIFSIDLGGPSPLWQVPLLELEVLGRVGKLAEEQAMEGNPVSELPSTVVSASVPASSFLPALHSFPQ